MITKKELLEETYGTLEPIKEMKSGLVVYNKPHFKKNFIDITNEINIIKRKIKQGWDLRPGKYKFILRAPEAVLCDLSEVYPNPTFDLHEILTLFRILNSVNLESLINKLTFRYFPNLEVVLFDTKFSELELRVAGSDKRIFKLPQILYRFLKNTKMWTKKFREVKHLIKNRSLKIKKKDLNKCKERTQIFFKKLSSEYSFLSDKIKLPDTAIFGFWKELPKCDFYIFVPKSGIKYALGFIEETNQLEKIMLWECHLSLDMTKELKIFPKKLKGKQIALIDRTYSSNTLDYLGEKIKEEGGRVVKIALFPKSKRAIQHSDFFIFLDKLISSNTVQLKKNSWGEELFIKIINEN